MALAPRLFTQEGFDARDLAPHFFHFRRRFHAARGALKAKLVQLLAQLFLTGLKLVRTLLTHRARLLTGLHSPTSVCWRVTKRVLIGSLCAARRSASSAISRVTPSIS